jgi:lipoprotein-anchoring transpeptidase ErfK/SrfK
MPWSSQNPKRSEIRTLISLVMLATVAARSAAQSNGGPAQQGRIPRQIVISIPDRKLAVLENGRVLRVFSVAVGAAVSPSPAGQFRIVTRLTNPTYYHPGLVIAPGPENPIGTRWIGLGKKGFGIHGTNAPGSIGKAASHGCIRLRNRDVEALFPMVSVGDTVEIRAERDLQTVQLFGTAPAAGAVTLAQAAPGTAAGGQ